MKRKIKTFDEITDTFFKWFDSSKRLAFFSSLILGLLIHLEVYTKGLLNPDGLWKTNQYISGNFELSLGRWMLRFLDILRFGTVNHVINSVVAITIISVITMLIVDLFKIKNKILIVIFSVIMVASPYVGDTLTSPFCSDEYALSFLLSVLSVFIIKKNNYKWPFVLLGGLCLTFSLGIYQAYLSSTMSLCIIVLIYEIIDNKADHKENLSHLLKFLVMGLFGLILYYLILKINLLLYGVKMNTYSGADSIGINNLKMLSTLIPQAYNSVSNYFFRNNVMNNFYYRRQYLMIVLIILCGISYTKILLKNKNFKNSLISIIYFMIIPICLGVTEIIAPERDINLLMSAAMPFVFIVPLFLQQKIDQSPLFNILNISSILVIFAIGYTYILMTGCTYTAIDKTYKQAYSTSLRVVDRIEQIEGYNHDSKIMITSGVNNEYFKLDNVIYKMASGNFSYLPIFWNGYGANNVLWQIFINNNIGTSFNYASDEEYLNIIQTDEFKKMDIFPEENSVKKINNIIVVKMNYEPFVP